MRRKTSWRTLHASHDSYSITQLSSVATNVAMSSLCPLEGAERVSTSIALLIFCKLMMTHLSLNYNRACRDSPCPSDKTLAIAIQLPIWSQNALYWEGILCRRLSYLFASNLIKISHFLHTGYSRYMRYVPQIHYYWHYLLCCDCYYWCSYWQGVDLLEGGVDPSITE